MSIHIIDAGKNAVAESVLMPGDPLRAKYIAENFLTDAVLYSDVRQAYGYTGTYKGVPVSVQTSGMGMPSMGIYSYELLNEFDVERIVRVGTAGAFRKEIKLGDILLAVAASTDSNYAHTFELNGMLSPCASWELIKKAHDKSKELGIDVKGGNVVSCDVFYEDNPDWWKKWEKVGVLGVEMEAAALYMNAARAHKKALALMTVTDHFISEEKADNEQRMHASGDMIRLALETLV